MKIHQRLFQMLLISSLALSITAQADVVVDSPNHAQRTNQDAEYVDSFLLPPKLNASGDILYLSGGIGSDSLSQMKKLAPSFPLELVLVERTDAYYRESYIADVLVNISNDGKPALNTVTEGPYLLVDLPDGQYLITATFNDTVRTRKVTIKPSKHSRVVLLWDKRTPQTATDLKRE